MRVTKHEHATLRVQKNGQTLIIDPGAFTAQLTDVDNLVGIVITHEHPDHWTPEHLDHLRHTAPGVPIYAPQSVVQQAPGFRMHPVAAGDTHQVGDFSLAFFGGEHCIIHSSIPVVENVGVLVDDQLYYPGDSYATPEGIDVSILAAPLGAPWLKIGEAIDFVLAVAPRHAFGTHDATLSDIGKPMHRERLRWATEKNGGQFYDLDAGDAIEIE